MREGNQKSKQVNRGKTRAVKQLSPNKEREKKNPNIVKTIKRSFPIEMIGREKSSGNIRSEFTNTTKMPYKCTSPRKDQPEQQQPTL